MTTKELLFGKPNSALGSSTYSHEEHVDEGETVEGRENVVHVVVDVPQERRHCKGKGRVEKPVRRGGKRHSLRSDLGGEDLGRVCPRDRTPCLHSMSVTLP